MSERWRVGERVVDPIDTRGSTTGPIQCATARSEAGELVVVLRLGALVAVLDPRVAANLADTLKLEAAFALARDADA